MIADIIEPTVPFSLGILVSNEGFGTAINLHITSGQPEIIENEKGLLIQFAIIGAQLGIEPVSPSLRITFGDIAPHTTEMARWLMTSSLKGVFSNYSATFENTNPLGDLTVFTRSTYAICELKERRNVTLKSTSLYNPSSISVSI